MPPLQQESTASKGCDLYATKKEDGTILIGLSEDGFCMMREEPRMVVANTPILLVYGETATDLEQRLVLEGADMSDAPGGAMEELYGDALRRVLLDQIGHINTQLLIIRQILESECSAEKLQAQA